MDPYELVDPQSVRDALRGFPADSRRRGEDLQRRGSVIEWEVVEPGSAYSATVLDKARFVVEVFSEESEIGEEEWVGDCDCEKEYECEHIYAVYKELLAQKAAADVQRLSANLSSSIA